MSQLESLKQKDHYVKRPIMQSRTPKHYYMPNVKRSYFT